MLIYRASAARWFTSGDCGGGARASAPILEPPGFMLLISGRATAAVTVLLHLAYGAIVGAFAAGF